MYSSIPTMTESERAMYNAFYNTNLSDNQLRRDFRNMTQQEFDDYVQNLHPRTRIKQRFKRLIGEESRRRNEHKYRPLEANFNFFPDRPQPKIRRTRVRQRLPLKQINKQSNVAPPTPRVPIWVEDNRNYHSPNHWYQTPMANRLNEHINSLEANGGGGAAANLTPMVGNVNNNLFRRYSKKINTMRRGDKAMRELFNIPYVSPRQAGSYYNAKNTGVAKMYKPKKSKKKGKRK